MGAGKKQLFCMAPSKKPNMESWPIAMQRMALTTIFTNYDTWTSKLYNISSEYNAHFHRRFGRRSGKKSDQNDSSTRRSSDDILINSWQKQTDRSDKLHKKGLCSVVLLLTLWEIWMERSNRVFRSIETTPRSLASKGFVRSRWLLQPHSAVTTVPAT